MNIKRSQVLSVLTVLGIPEDTYERWEEKGIVAQKLKRIDNFKNPDQTFTDQRTGLLFEELAAAGKKGEEVTIEDDRTAATPPAKEAAAPAKEKPAAAPKPAKVEKPKPEPKAATAKAAKPTKTPAAKPVKATKPPKERKAVEKIWAGYGIYAEKPLEFSDRGPGVARAIVTILEKAGEAKKPLTKEEIHEKLKVKFKDRDPKALMTSVNNQVPSRLRLVRGLHVWKSKNRTNETAYFLDPATKGKTAQPRAAAEKPATAAKPQKPATTAAKPSANGRQTAGKTARKKPAAAE